MKQIVAVCIGRNDQSQSDPYAPELHGMLEAQVTLMHTNLRRHLHDQQSDQVVRELMDPQLVLKRW